EGGVKVSVVGELRRREVTVLHALQYLSEGEGKVAVSQRDLATALGWKQHTGIRHTTVSLERHGLIRVTNNSTPERRLPNTFEVTALGRFVAEVERSREVAA